MAPAAQSDNEMDSHTSDMASQDSPLRRQFSEPFHDHSASTQASPSPSPMAHKSKCAWCGEYFESSNDDKASQNEALKEHIATVHPHIVKFSMYDGTGDEEEEEEEDDDENDEFRDVDERSGDEDDNAALEYANGEAAEGDEVAEAGQNGVAESTEIYADNDTDVNEVDVEGDGEGPEGESDLALSNQLHEFSREQDSISLEKRLHNFWNINDTSKFCKDYEEKTVGLENSWFQIFNDPKRGKKRDTSDFPERPNPYTKNRVAKGEFLEVTPLEDILIQLRDPEMRSADELYAITENVAYILKAWQDEHLAIEKLQKLATRHNVKSTSGPRKFDRPEVFEDKKEAMLYGYKHDPKEDKVRNQNPFVQGGFKPTPAQFRKLTAKVGVDNPNPDGFRTINKFGVEHVPKFQNPPREEFVGKTTRNKRKAAEMEAASRANETDEAPGETPVPAEPEQDNISKRRTRTRRSAADGEVQPGSPAPIRISTRGRGRGRGRGAAAARAVSRGTSETPQPLTNIVAPARASGRAYAREGPAPTAGLLQTRPAAAQLAPIEPAPSGGPANESPTGTLMGDDQNGSIDPAEQARRDKIANSKNPKRTEAMLNHWARFNREGRTRNPKRSKAQIEADRVADAHRKAIEPPKVVGRKTKSISPVFGGPTPADTGLAPAPTMPLPASLMPGHPGPHPQLAPMPPARGSMGPYAPIDPRAVAPFPPGPPGPLQQPPQPYHTPYPDLYLGYGPVGLPPPPGHPRAV